MKHAPASRIWLAMLAAAAFLLRVDAQAQQSPAAANAQAAGGLNLSLVATPSTSYVSGHETLEAINDGFDPRNSNDTRRGEYGNWPRTETQWIEYDWSQPISTNRVEVYWFIDGRGVHAPAACRLKYWNGTEFVEVAGAKGLGLEADRFNTTTFDAVKTTKLRLEMDGDGTNSTGVMEWKVIDAGDSPNFPPRVDSGPARVVVLPAKTLLEGTVKDDGKPAETPTVQWSKLAGPGDVAFENAKALSTSAAFSAPGEYALRLTADDGQASSSATMKVKVAAAPSAQHLEPVYTTSYKLDSPLWSARMKALMVNWIPHCIEKINDPNLREGGIDNFIQAAKKLAGEPAKRHVGYPFSNAWVYNTIEAMSVGLQVDPQGDPEIVKAQALYRATLADWIPKILAAQEPDGYLQTNETLNGYGHWTRRGDHEGYTGGYFLEAALAHYLMSGRKDPTLYNAAKKLADCWCENLGPAPKKAWFDGHQEMEQALVRFGRFVNENEGDGKGDKYIQLAKFLLDQRAGGSDYDQSRIPVTQQYEVVGHAVRAVYCLSGMADVALETGDPQYRSAVMSLWDDLVNRKYYVTGGVGSGETSEGFGKDFSLPNSAYCESCSGCGELFFQWKMNLAYGDAKYADLYEETLYNAILSDLDLDGNNFCYTNPLDARQARGPWHQCPCCVSNISRTMLMLPTWMYAKSSDAVYVNLFVGSTVSVGKVGSADVELVQKTDYPWNGKVAITVNPSSPSAFGVMIRVPDRSVSELYSSEPQVGGLLSLAVNGETISPKIENGYAEIRRDWKAGDRIEFELPMAVQRVKADSRIAADRGRVALKFGPLVYNIEDVDQSLNSVLESGASLAAEWKKDLLGGVMAINGKFADGSPLLAIPNYARNNRGGRSVVWMRDE